MARTQIIRGTAAELIPVLEKLDDRPDLTLIIPIVHAPTDEREPTAVEIEEANARLRRHIVSLPSAPELDNDQIDADLASAYGGASNKEK